MNKETNIRSQSTFLILTSFCYSPNSSMSLKIPDKSIDKSLRQIDTLYKKKGLITANAKEREADNAALSKIIYTMPDK